MRDPAAVAADVADQVVTPDAAKEVYGVIIADNDSGFDGEATDALRADMRAARLVQEAAE